MDNFTSMKQRMEKFSQDRNAFYEKIKGDFAAVVETKTGFEVISHILGLCRVFANSLEENQKLKQMGAGDGYLPALQDLGKTILSYLPKEQIARLFIETNKGEQNGKNTNAGGI